MGGALVLDKEVAIGFFVSDETAGSRADDAGGAIAVVERNRQSGLLYGFVLVANWFSVIVASCVAWVAKRLQSPRVVR